jgi:hypothetical protein
LQRLITAAFYLRQAVASRVEELGHSVLMSGPLQTNDYLTEAVAELIVRQPGFLICGRHWRLHCGQQNPGCAGLPTRFRTAGVEDDDMNVLSRAVIGRNSLKSSGRLPQIRIRSAKEKARKKVKAIEKAHQK